MNRQGTFTIASEADAGKYAGFKPYYIADDVTERFRWLAEDVDGIWVLLEQEDEGIGWCVVVWSDKKDRISVRICRIYSTDDYAHKTDKHAIDPSASGCL